MFLVDMIIKRWLILVLTMAMTAVVACASNPDDFRRLDSLIAAQPQIIKAKEARLAQLKAEAGALTDPVGRYEAMKQLYEEYAAYQYDSAYACVTECLRLANEMGDKRLLNESRLNLAHILSTACLTDKAQLALNQIDTCLNTLSASVA